MAQLRLILQEPERGEGEGESRTNILGNFLRLKMDGADRRIRRRRSLKERLGLKGIGCCGATWGGVRPTAMEDEEQQQQQQQQQEHQEEGLESRAMEIVDLGEEPGPSDPECVVLVPAGSGMNLAAALAAERHFRSAEEGADAAAALPGTPVRVSLMRLLEETTDGGDLAAEEAEKVGSDLLCCVCMGRKKGAAFIPCGHTFCRVCSREVWLNRGTCPICNRLILEILDIF